MVLAESIRQNTNAVRISFILRTVITSLFVKLWQPAGGQQIIRMDNTDERHEDGSHGKNCGSVIVEIRYRMQEPYPKRKYRSTERKNPARWIRFCGWLRLDFRSFRFVCSRSFLRLDEHFAPVICPGIFLMDRNAFVTIDTDGKQ